MDAPDARRQLLNQAQKNSLRISLMLVEKGMLDMERRLAAGEYHGILFRTIDDLGEGTKTSIRQLIHDIREVIQELKDRFQLEVEVEETRLVIFGKAPLLWEMVTETDASRLRRYGEVDPRLTEALDPSIEQLSQLLLTIHQLVAKDEESIHPKSP